MEWRLEEGATGAEDSKEAEEAGGVAWTQQGEQETRGDEESNRWSNGNSESKRERESEMAELLESAVECGRRTDGNKLRS